jgi:D-alanyl-D-alanine carboxypeptidase/D-alanyl-D-alanine-endopeptidase (penicillin-binding protein 4)
MHKIFPEYNQRFFLFLFALFFLASCSVQQKIHRSAKADVLNTKALQAAHVGISIFDPAANKYVYNFQGDKYFVPASNIKIPTCYAAMKYLGDSLVGLRYGIPEEKGWSENVVVIKPTGDPTFLHSDYKTQPIFDFLNNTVKSKNKKPGILIDESKVERWGNGWSWNDYGATYMAERNRFPIFGNVLEIKLNDSAKWIGEEVWPEQFKSNLFKTQSRFFDTTLNELLRIRSKRKILSSENNFSIDREISSNRFSLNYEQTKFSLLDIPLVTYDFHTTLNILSDTLKRKFSFVHPLNIANKYSWESDDGDIAHIHIKQWNKIHSQPTDSLLKPMMHRSDNFFAEQALLMVSNEMLGVMNDKQIIDTLLKTDFSNLPQKPRWVDGSGLSRYNLFTPQDLVTILNKMKNEFGMERIKEIFPTGGEGTISSYYKTDSSYIFGKTGTLSGVVAFSGFLYTKKRKLLLFSTLVNNHQASATDVRRAVERFLLEIRENF